MVQCFKPKLLNKKHVNEHRPLHAHVHSVCVCVCEALSFCSSASLSGLFIRCLALDISHANAHTYSVHTHTQMLTCMQKQGHTRWGKQQASVWKLCMERAQRISHAINVWAADMISAPWTGVVLSPLKRCCHSAFIFSPCWWERAWMPPNGENAQQGHSWAVWRMGEGEETVFACVHRAKVCKCLVTRLCLCMSVSSCGHASLWCHLAWWRKSHILT